MCWKRKLCQRKITQKDCKRGRLADPVILPLKTKWQPLLSLQWLRDPTKRPPTCGNFTHNYETTWPTSLREASSANRMQEKTQLFPDDLRHLTLSPWVQACLFPHTFISLLISCCYEFSRLSSFFWSSKCRWKVNHSAASNKSTGTEGSDTKLKLFRRTTACNYSVL